ncbi:uncharacterized protein MELLADRAFT_114987 [Melampsora larici-populina 98AG31]|uniref:Uncharacterized protein n=1 Tax=Melampsora larici-populina (strain 98AG31 / pathotype 3-4-7) TaxID=747676 RepID=F4R2Z3_MELLP|nr:uncharacterized protein MELLADRAFT_114987 [Melampsora larici-populina 98AG31]EGG12900.1 hypothetical protein MELLADRAFT_114987 [Melampsora larici-populina 98AG31]
MRKRGSDESFACGGFSRTVEEGIEEIDQRLLVDQRRAGARKSRPDRELQQPQLPIHCSRLDVPSNDLRKKRLAELEEMTRLYETSGLGIEIAKKSTSLHSSNTSIAPSVIPSAMPDIVPNIIPGLDSYGSIPRARVIVQQLPERPMTHKYQTAIREGRRLTRITNQAAALPQNPAASRQVRNSATLLLPFQPSESTKTPILEHQAEPLASRREVCAESGSEEDLKDRSYLGATHKHDSSRTSRLRASGLFGHILRPRKSENASRASTPNSLQITELSPFSTFTPFSESDLRSESDISSRMSFENQLGDDNYIHVDPVQPLVYLDERTDRHVAGSYDASSLTSHTLESASYSSLWHDTPASSISPSTRSRDSACHSEVPDGPPSGIAQSPKIREEVRYSSSFLDFNEDDVEDSSDLKHIWKNISMSTMSKNTTSLKELKEL